jgi:putative FmdB family regulatory protein
MPIFDYSCKGCGHRFDALVLRNEVVSCSKCGSQDLEKNITLPALKTDGTHAQALKAAKQRDKRQARDNYWTQRDYERAHYEEDTGIKPKYEETPKKYKFDK